MPFFKIPMEDSPEHEAIFPWLIAEATDARAAYDLAVCHIPEVLGEANDAERSIEAISDAELPNAAWPVFMQAYFESQGAIAGAGIARHQP